ncbi:NADH-quinone oxidoreductase subunit NuoB [Anaerospora hongkongensis]|uniref:NADH-quinone oxidoreductase subunit NuoB n=1 Tax=Anaerospora hongkongensis TaxID=244830 RepID=UPI00289C55D3|nr:NADH-quinone oxidoreductase subunit NuoB [Anaerospora hongkongensis]
MLNVMRKIVATGTVTKNWEAVPLPEQAAGEVRVLPGNCRDCRQCLTACPTQAITMRQEVPVIEQKACIFCGLCVEACPAGCLEQTNNYKLASLGGALADDAAAALKKKIRSALGRSLHVRHVDIGSCNACDFEMSHLCNPIYDVQQYGIDFVASPRHADLLMVTGVVTRNSTQALQMTYEAAPAPKLVMAVGSCACSGRTYGDSYAIRGAVDALVPVDVYVPGCPPRPQALIHGIMLALDRL